MSQFFSINISVSLTLALASISPAHAALQSRAGGTMVYDTDRNITWVADANLFQTQAVSNTELVSQVISNIGQINDIPNTYDTPSDSGYHTLSLIDFDVNSGKMSWFGAKAWVDNLVYGGYSDWRLPTTVPTDFGYNQTGSEMGHLFYSELGGVANSTISSHHENAYNLFNHVSDTLHASTYWSAAEYTPDPISAWVFSTFNGNQGRSRKFNTYYAWAVRDGDVAIVPVPGAIWLFGTGLLGLLSSKLRGN